VQILSQHEAFRLSVLCSDLIVVCRVSGMMQVLGDYRLIGDLEVERVLSGTATVGETLMVPWSSQVSVDGNPVISDPKVPLSALIGLRVLIFLRQDDHLRLAGASPLPLTLDSAAALGARVSWIRSPSSEDLLARRLEGSWRGEGVPAPCDSVRLEVVAAYLEGYLDGVDSGVRPPEKAGRSN
jgi:hypothetical protein